MSERNREEDDRSKELGKRPCTALNPDKSSTTSDPESNTVGGEAPFSYFLASPKSIVYVKRTTHSADGTSSKYDRASTSATSPHSLYSVSPGSVMITAYDTYYADDKGASTSGPIVDGKECANEEPEAENNDADAISSQPGSAIEKPEEKAEEKAEDQIADQPSLVLGSCINEIESSDVGDSTGTQQRLPASAIEKEEEKAEDQIAAPVVLGSGINEIESSDVNDSSGSQMDQQECPETNDALAAVAISSQPDSAIEKAEEKAEDQISDEPSLVLGSGINEIESSDVGDSTGSQQSLPASAIEKEEEKAEDQIAAPLVLGSGIDEIKTDVGDSSGSQQRLPASAIEKGEEKAEDQIAAPLVLGSVINEIETDVGDSSGSQQSLTASAIEKEGEKAEDQIAASLSDVDDSSGSQQSRPAYAIEKEEEKAEDQIAASLALGSGSQQRLPAFAIEKEEEKAEDQIAASLVPGSGINEIESSDVNDSSGSQMDQQECPASQTNDALAADAMSSQPDSAIEKAEEKAEDQIAEANSLFPGSDVNDRDEDGGASASGTIVDELQPIGQDGARAFSLASSVNASSRSGRDQQAGKDGKDALDAVGAKSSQNLSAKISKSQSGSKAEKAAPIVEAKDDTSVGTRGRGHKYYKTHKFWETQHVPQFKDMGDTSLPDGPIVPATALSEVKQEPYGLHHLLEWITCDMKSDEMCSEVYEFFKKNYQEKADSRFKLSYSREHLRWAMRGGHPSWHIGVRVKTTQKLVGFISGVPTRIRVRGEVVKMAKVDFWCVIMKYRSQGLSTVLINELARRVKLQDTWQAVYMTEEAIPTPFATCQSYFRMLNPGKLIDVGLARLKKGVSMKLTKRLNELPGATITPGFRKMERHDILAVTRLLKHYLPQFQAATEFDHTDVEHWLLPREDMVHTYVVQSPRTQEVTDMCSFYTVPLTVVGDPKYSTVQCAYSSYNVATETSLTQLMKDALIVSKQKGMDVFYALDVMHNGNVFRDLKFEPADSQMHYHLYNYRLSRALEPSQLGLTF